MWKSFSVIVDRDAIYVRFFKKPRSRSSSLSKSHGTLTPPPPTQLKGCIKNFSILRFVLKFFKQPMGARNRVGIGLSYRPDRLNTT